MPVTPAHRRAVEFVRHLIWWFYGEAYCRAPTACRRAVLRARFDRIFRRRTGSVMLDRLLARLDRRKRKLLRILQRPEIPLYTKGSENDVRAFVTKRKVSGGRVSEAGRRARDVLLGQGSLHFRACGINAVQLQARIIWDSTAAEHVEEIGRHGRLPATQHARIRLLRRNGSWVRRPTDQAPTLPQDGREALGRRRLHRRRRAGGKAEAEGRVSPAAACPPRNDGKLRNTTASLSLPVLPNRMALVSQPASRLATPRL